MRKRVFKKLNQGAEAKWLGIASEQQFRGFGVSANNKKKEEILRLVNIF